jgi:gamma-glutamyltranspeptidase/glutathione hydrolase/leukotriene-C4 hydrolase
VLAEPSLRAVFAPAGRVAGETYRNPALVATLERVAEEGAAAFYDVRAAGGIVTTGDLSGYNRTRWR